MKVFWVFLFFCIALIWGSVMSIIKILLLEYSPIELIILRLSIATLVVMPYLIIKRPKIHKKDRIWFVVTAILLYPVYQLGLVMGETQVNAGLAGLILAFTPILATFFSFLFFKEDLNQKQIVGFVISIIGMAILCGISSIFQDFNAYVLWILVAVFAGAIALNFEKSLLKRYSVLDVLPICIFIGGIWAVFFLPSVAGKFIASSYVNQGLVLYLAILPIIVGHTLMAFVVKDFSMKLASSVMFVVPIVSLGFAWLLLGEIPNTVQLLGAAAVFVGIFFVVFPKNQKLKS